MGGKICSNRGASISLIKKIVNMLVYEDFGKSYILVGVMGRNVISGASQLINPIKNFMNFG